MNLLFKRLVAIYTLTCFLSNIVLAQQVVKPQVVKQVGISAPVAVSLSLHTQGQPADPALKTAMNGTTVVDIATPSAKGISNNTWNDFNVDENGIIFNNSAAPVLTQLGGWVDGNRRLAGGSASIILNQVLGANRSSLLGQIEVAGKSAEFILANPNGITCNGCGFINTPSVSLITGQSRFAANGDLLFDVSGGDALLEGRGLNAANVDRFDIVSRYAQINANVFANNLNIINGSNEFNYSSKAVTTHDAANANNGVKFAFSTSALGSMYGNSIRLIGTEKGLGVNLQGLVQSLKDLEITADGDLQLRNVLANNSLNVQSLSGNVNVQELAYAKTTNMQAAHDITNNGLLAASDNISLTAQRVNQAGNLYAGLNSDNTLNNHAGFSVAATSMNNSGVFYLGGAFVGNATSVTNDGTMIFGGADSLAFTSFDNHQSVHLQADYIDVQANTLTNSGEILHEGSGKLVMQVAESLNNSGVLGSNGQLQLSAAAVNNQGRIFANNTQLDAGTFNNDAGELQSAQLTLHADHFTNSKGQLLALGDATSNSQFLITGDLDNRAGVIYSDAGQFWLTASSLDNQGGTFVVNDVQQAAVNVSGFINNDGGTFQANALSVQAGALSNQDGEWLGKSLTGNVAAITNTGGFIQSNNFDLYGKTLDNNGGVILAAGMQRSTLSLDFTQSINNHNNAVVRQLNGDVSLQSSLFDNDASVVDASQNGSITINAATLLNNAGLVNALDGVTIASDSFANSDGYVSAKNIQMDVSGNAIVSDRGVLQGALQLNANNFTNSSSYLLLGDNSTLIVSDTFNNLNGAISTADGVAVKSVQINANSITNSGEMAFSADTVSVNAAKRIDNSGVLKNVNGLTISTGELVNDQGSIQAGQLEANASTAIRNINSGYLSGTTLTLTSPTIYNNSGGVIDAIGVDQASMQFNTRLFDNQGGVLKSAAHDWQLNLANFDNKGGEVIHTGSGTLSLNSNALFINEGLLYSANKLDLTVNELDNRGQLLAGHQLTLSSAAGITNSLTGGIAANDSTVLIAQQQQIDNQGYWYFGNALAGSSSMANSDLLNSGKLIFGDGLASNNIQLQPASLHNSGDISYNNSGNLIVDSSSFINDGDVIALNGGVYWNRSDVDPTSQGFANNSAIIASRIQLRDTLSNDPLVNNGALQAQAFVIDASHFINNSDAVLQGSGNAAWDWNATRISNSGDWINNANDWTIDQRIDGSGRILHTGTGEFSFNPASGSDLTGAYLNTQGHATLSGGIQGGSIDVQDAQGQTQQQHTTLFSDQGITLTGASAFTNSGTYLVTDRDIVLQTSLVNDGNSVLQAGVQFTLADNSHTMDINNAGVIQADGFDISGNQLLNTGNMYASGINIPSSHISVNQLSNLQGGLLLFGNSDNIVDAVNHIDNQGQLIANQLTLTGPVLNNQLGTIAALGDVTLSTQNISHLGTIQAGNNLSLNLSGDLAINDGDTLQTSGALNISAQGDIKNGGEINAHNQIKLSGVNLINENTGHIIAGFGLVDSLTQASFPSEFNFTNSLVNNGSISIAGDLKVVTPDFLNSSSAVLVTGGNASFDVVDFNTGKFTNQGTIYSFGDLDVSSANLIANASSAQLIAVNNMNLTGNTLDNNQSRIETIYGDMMINVATGLTNQTTAPDMNISYPSYQVNRGGFGTNDSYYDQVRVLSIAETTIRTFSSATLPANIYAGANLVINGTADISNVYGNIFAANNLDINGANFKNQFAAEGVFVEIIGLNGTPGPTQCAWSNEFQSNQCQSIPNYWWNGQPTTTTQQTFTNSTASIHAGNNITGNLSGSITNYPSTNNGSANPQQLDTAYNGTPITGVFKDMLDQVLPKATQQQFYTSAELTAGQSTDAATNTPNSIRPVDGGSNPTDDLGLVAAGNTQRDTLDSQIPGQLANAQAQAAANNQWPLISFTVLPYNFTPMSLGSLYVLNQDPGSNYLIETRPEFTQYGTFLGSDYLLNELGYDPDQSIKRIGDAFYENQLIRDALITQTNSRYVDDVTNDFEQMQLLMNNAVKEAKNLQLTIGVELTPQQSAALTQDMMWLVKRNVLGHEVLVPQLYLVSVSPEKIAASKAVIGAGGNINLNAKSISNQGSVYSGGSTSMVADTLRNTADMHTGGDLSLIANSLQNNSALSAGNNLMLVTRGNLQQDGQLFAQGDVRLLAAGGITNQGTVKAVGDILAVAQGAAVNSSAGQIQATGNLLLQSTQSNVINDHGLITGNNVTLDAKNNVEQIGHDLTAVNQLSLIAGNDVLLKAETIESVRNVGDSTQRRIDNITSSLTAGGNLSLVAGRDVQLEGADVTAGNNIDMQAGRDINLQAVANESSSEYYSKRHQEVHKEVTHDLVDLQSGGNVTLTAGQDTNLVGTNITAGNNIAINATRDTNISVVVDSVYDYSSTTKKGFFGRSKTTIDESLHETSSGSNLVAGDNVLMNVDINDNGELVNRASNDINLLGANINAQGNVVMHADNNVNVDALVLEDRTLHQDKKSSTFGLKKTDQGTSTVIHAPSQSTINAGASVQISSGNDINLIATQVNAGELVKLDAANDVFFGVREKTTDTETWRNVTSLVNMDTVTGLMKDSIKFMDKMSGDPKLTTDPKERNGYKTKNDLPQVTAKSHFNQVDSTTASAHSVENVSSSITAGSHVIVNAGRDVTLQSTDVKAGGDIAVQATRDINLQAMADATAANANSKHSQHSESSVVNNLADLQSDGNVSLKAGNDINLIGATVTAANNIALSAQRDTNISAVVDSVHDYQQVAQKGSFGKKKSNTDEALYETAVGGVVSGNNILVNAHVNDEGQVIGEKSGNVNLLGAQMNARSNVIVSADEDVSVSGIQTQSSDYHRTEQSSSLGLRKKDQGDVEKNTRMQNASVAASGNIVILANNIKLVGANVTSTDGNINMEAVDELLVGAGEITQSLQNWNTNSGVFSGGKIYSKQEHKDGVTEVGAQASNISAGGVVNAKAGAIKIEGSNIFGDQGVGLSADSGDIEITAAATHSESYTYDKDLSVGLGDVGKNLARPDKMIKSKNGRLTIKFADAQYSEVDEKTTGMGAQSSIIESKNGDVIANATAGKVILAGSEIHADAGSVGLIGANGVDVTTAAEAMDTVKKTTTATAEMSVVVQHQAVEVVMAIKNVKEAKDKLEQSKKDYTNFQRNLDGLETQLKSLEADYAVKTPGINYDDIVDLRDLISDTKGDNSFYKAGIVLAALNVTTSVITLVQQIATAAASTGTYGFNAGVQLDLDATKTTAETHDTFEMGSAITANNVVIQTGSQGGDGAYNAKGTITNIHGSTIAATDTVAINTGELNVTAGEATHEGDAETMHGHITAQVTVYGAAGGASISGSFDRSRNSDRSNTYTNSEITADKINVTTINDANFRGASVRADSQLDMDVGGDLNVESVQDRYSSHSASIGISAGVSFGGKTSQEGSSPNATESSGSGGNTSGAQNSSGSNWHGAEDVGGVSGVNAGINISNGRSSSKETVLTSLTSGGTANINVKGHTQLTGAEIATTDKDGNDLGNLNFSTSSFDFTDLRNTNYDSNTRVGISSNFAVSGGSKDAKAPTNESTTPTGKKLNTGTTNFTYDNSQTNEASKTLATLGHGNITIGGVEVEKNGEATETDLLLTGLNRDTSKLDKSLWSSNTSQSIDVTLDHRMLTKEGRADIKQQFEDAPENLQKIAQDVPAPNGGNAVENAVGKALNKLGTWTGGLLPGDENHGGLIAQLPVLFGANDIKAGAFQIRFTGDPLINTEEYIKATDLPYFDTLEGPGKEKLQDMWVTKDAITKITKDNSTYQNYTNGILNNLPQALVNGMEQTGSKTVTEFFNPSHGIIGDLFESGVDKLGGNQYIHSGVARQGGKFIKDVTIARSNYAPTNFVSHSQGTLVFNAGLTMLDKSDFSLITFTKETTPTFFINGPAVNAETMADSVRKLGFGFAGSNANKDDLVAEMVGRNQDAYIPELGQGTDEPMPWLESIGRVTNLPKLFGNKYPTFDPNTNQQTNKTSPHSTYTCLINCGDKPIGSDTIGKIIESIKEPTTNDINQSEENDK